MRWGGGVWAVVTDVSDAAAVEDLAQGVMREFGRVDVVVNNAGAARELIGYPSSTWIWPCGTR